MFAKDGSQKVRDIRNKNKSTMKLYRLILCTILSISVISISNAQEKKAIKGFSGGMMVHSGYQFGGDNPYNLDISSPTFGIGGCAKLHLTSISERDLRDISQLLPSVMAFKAEVTTNYSGLVF